MDLEANGIHAEKAAGDNSLSRYATHSQMDGRVRNAETSTEPAWPKR
jgi:hypothetical protein